MKRMFSVGIRGGWLGMLIAALLVLGGCSDGGGNGDDDQSASSPTPAPGDDDQTASSPTPAPGDDDQSASSPTPAPGDDDQTASSPTPAPGDDDQTASSPTPAPGDDDQTASSPTPAPGDDDQTASSPTPAPGDDDQTASSPTPGPVDADHDGASSAVDCDDQDVSSYPGAVELCDGRDNNCNGQIDEGVKPTYYLDADKDGYGTSTVTTQACVAPAGYVSSSTDCNDSNVSIHPGAAETCNGADDNCDGSIDEGVKETWYQDADGDGFGDAAVSEQACTAPAGYVSSSTDCNDADPSLHPGATGDECAAGRDLNCDGAVGTLIANGDSLAVDVPVVNVTVTVTLAGRAVSATNTSSTDYGRIKLRDTKTHRTFPLFDLWNATTLTAQGTVTSQVMSGTYDILYDVGANGPNWPDNQNAVLKSAVALTASQSLALDIPVISVPITPTLNGATVSTSNTSSTDFGTFKLRDTTTLELFTLFSTWYANATTGASYLVPSYTAQLIPGTYDLVYAVGADGPHWPANDFAVLKSAVALTTPQSLTINVPLVNFTPTVTLSSQSVSSTNTSSADYGKLELRDTTTLAVFKIMSTYDKNTGKVVPQLTQQVIPGTYDLLYSVGKDGPKWPSNTHQLLKSALALTTSQSLTVNIPTVNITCTTTLGGQALSSTNGSGADEGELKLRDVATQEIFSIYTTWDDASNVPNKTYYVQVIPGTFDLLYGVKDNGSSWPDNQKALLKSALALTTNQSLAVNIPYAQVTFNMTLAGQPITSANASATDEGTLELRDVVTGDTFHLFSVWNDTANVPKVPYATRVLPGTYDLIYTVGSDGPHWPGNSDVVLKAGVVISNGQTITVDVPVSEITVNVTLGGQALSTGNTAAADEGAITLEDLSTLEMWDAFSTYNDTSLTVTASHPVQLIPGNYGFLYTVVDDGPHWPSNQDQQLGCFTTK